jgi:HAD superfamily hydrolase (TIGR01509 family)
VERVRIDGVLFDLDGTLVDSNALHVDAWVRGAGAHGFAVEADAVRRLVGMGGDQLLPTLLGEEAEQLHGDAVRTSVGDSFARVLRDRSVSLFTGAEATLVALRARGARLALATSASMEDLERMMRAAGTDLRALVDEVVTRSDVESSKPAPDVIEAALGKLGVPPHSCLMVGDTEYDVIAANRAGVRTIGVLTSGLADEAEIRRRLTEAGVAMLWPSVGALTEPVRRGGAAALLAPAGRGRPLPLGG